MLESSQSVKLLNSNIETLYSDKTVISNVLYRVQYIWECVKIIFTPNTNSAEYLNNCLIVCAQTKDLKPIEAILWLHGKNQAIINAENTAYATKYLNYVYIFEALSTNPVMQNKDIRDLLSLPTEDKKTRFIQLLTRTETQLPQFNRATELLKSMPEDELPPENWMKILSEASPMTSLYARNYDEEQKIRESFVSFLTAYHEKYPTCDLIPFFIEECKKIGEYAPDARTQLLLLNQELTFINKEALQNQIIDCGEMGKQPLLLAAYCNWGKNPEQQLRASHFTRWLIGHIEGIELFDGRPPLIAALEHPSDRVMCNYTKWRMQDMRLNQLEKANNFLKTHNLSDQTLLHYAVTREEAPQIEILKWLVNDLHIDPSVRDKNQKTALNYLQERANQAIPDELIPDELSPLNPHINFLKSAEPTIMDNIQQKIVSIFN